MPYGLSRPAPLPAPELERRLRLYRDRAAQGVCIFTGAPPAPRLHLAELAALLGMTDQRTLARCEADDAREDRLAAQDEAELAAEAVGAAG